MVLTKPQSKMFTQSQRHRFTVTVAGRRGGKTNGSGVVLLDKLRQTDRIVGYVAPTFGMAKRLMWSWLLVNTPPEWIKGRPNRSDMVIEFVWGAKLMLFGAHNYDAARGLGFFHVEFDEMQDIPREAWEEVFRPALSDLRGSAGFRGTPKGRGNFLFDLFAQAKTRPGWARLQYSTATGGLVHLEEIDAARAELDERTFRQEYEASFETYGGLAYYNFSDTLNVRPSPFDPHAETWLAWDFNAGERPMAVMVIQKTPTGYAVTREFVHRNTNTDEMCMGVKAWLIEKGLRAHLRITGDYAGNRRESSASRSDYLIIESHFKNFPDATYLYEKRAVPTTSIQDRINATCSLFKGGTLVIDPGCKKLIHGLLRVTWKDSGNGLAETSIGEIDPTDALSYFAFNYHPVHKAAATYRH